MTIDNTGHGPQASNLGSTCMYCQKPTWTWVAWKYGVNPVCPTGRCARIAKGIVGFQGIHQTQHEASLAIEAVREKKAKPRSTSAKQSKRRQASP